MPKFSAIAMLLLAITSSVSAKENPIKNAEIFYFTAKMGLHCLLKYPALERKYELNMYRIHEVTADLAGGVAEGLQAENAALARPIVGGLSKEACDGAIGILKAVGGIEAK